MSGHPPTDEQRTAVEAFDTGLSMALDALAGTGKTTTLEMLGASTRRPGAYMAFNKSIAAEASMRMPANVEARTVHSYAYRAVGHRFSRRIRSSGRMRGDQLARALDLWDPYVVHYGSQRKVIQPSTLAGHAMRAVKRFCQTDDPAPTREHVAYIDGIDLPTGKGERTWENNDRVREMLEPMLARIWADLQDPDGSLPYQHDCQPPGTLVRRVVRYGGGKGGIGEYEDVPIERVREGDRVVSYSMTTRRGYVRRAGRLVTAAGQRDFQGELITVRTGTGRSSSYTPEHRCVARLDCDLSEGNFVVYMARRGSDYRIGRTTWRTRSQNNSLGVLRRAESQRADAIWILSVHESDREAALAEALTAQQWRLPTWQFSSVNETMPLAEFWSKVGNNRVHAAACLRAYGRDVDLPLFERGDGWNNTRRPLVIRATNVLAGMLMLDVDAVQPTGKGYLFAYDGAGGWSPVAVSRTPYEGPVYNLDVDIDHTYIADGIATHNCYLKIWAAGDPQMGVSFLMVDEAQDLSRVMLQVAEKQRDCQLVFVGDANQSIYSWRGSIDAMQVADVDLRATLTQSFRFGQPVADVANWCLGHLPTELQVRGFDKVSSWLAPVDEPAAVLTRTNAGSLETLFAESDRGRRAHLVGGGSEVESFARAARDLMGGRGTGHPELACFDNWAQVVEYTEHDPQGDELALMVRLVDTYGTERILSSLERMPREAEADVVVSTAHKAKGREWSTVRVHGDFRQPDAGAAGFEEWRLLYVAATRAQHGLDVTVCPAFAEMLAPPAERRRPAIPLPPVSEAPTAGCDIDGETSSADVTPPEPEPEPVGSRSAQSILDLLKGGGA
jgi:hypothetical protein